MIVTSWWPLPLVSITVAIPVISVKVADAFRFPNWEIVTPGTNPAATGDVSPPIVAPNPITAFLDKDWIELSGSVIIWSFPKDNSGL